MTEKPKLALIVEDERVLLQLFSKVLGSAGYDVQTAANAVEAYDIAVNALPDVVVIDVILPDGNGLALLDRIRAIPELANIAAVCMTGYPISAVLAERAGCEMLNKPFPPTALLQAVEAALARRRDTGSSVNGKQV